MSQKVDLAKRPPLDEGNEYDLKASTKEIGQLYPVLKAADGEVIDGLHRTRSDPSWKTVVLEHIDTEKKKLIARLVANFHRRHVSREEKAAWINRLAELCQKEGCRVEGPRGKVQGPNEIVEKVCEITGLKRRTIMTYLDPRFKQQQHRRLDPSQHQVRSSPKDIIFNALAGRGIGWAQRVINRFQEEHETELLKSSLFRKKVLDMLPRQPIKPAIVFDPFKDQHIQDPQLISPEPHRQKPRPQKRKRKEDSSEGYEPLGSLYPDFIKECPDCICPKCPHANTCLERVRPED